MKALSSLGYGVVIPVLPYFAQSFGAGPTTISLLFSSFAFFSFLSSPFFGALSDRIRRRPVLLGSILTTAVGWFIVATGTALWMVFLGRIVDGLSARKLTTADTYLRLHRFCLAHAVCIPCSPRKSLQLPAPG